MIYPSLYQINTRVYLTDLSKEIGRKATLDDIPDSSLEAWAGFGINWIWLLSVWQTGEKGRQVSRTNAHWRKEFEDTLPDLQESDIPGSGFAITDYTVHQQLGGNEALIRLRERLRKHGLKLMLDFVPNHTAIDHPWAATHPDFYIHGNEQLIASQPENYTHVDLKHGSSILAYGRDPYFSGWPDTLQLNYGNDQLQQAMRDELGKISELCDGVRCDMSMLILPDVFKRTWGIEVNEFWPDAIQSVKAKNPTFVFLAEVYWDLEWRLQQAGFDFTYDKRLYDRLKSGEGVAVRHHLNAELSYQNRLTRFLENHDEERAALVFNESKHKAAAILTYITPGMRFFHQGQWEGRLKKISPHLKRGPKEFTNSSVESFYHKLLILLKQPVFQTQWQLAEVLPLNAHNQSHANFISFIWNAGQNRVAIVVNYSPGPGQCFIKFPLEVSGHWRFIDQCSDTVYVREGVTLTQQGMYFDEPAWKYYVFKLEHTR